jgi:hypothetical protein
MEVMEAMKRLERPAQVLLLVRAVEPRRVAPHWGSAPAPELIFSRIGQETPRMRVCEAMLSILNLG